MSGGHTPSPARIRLLPPQVQHFVIDAFVRAERVVFLTAAGVMLLAFALSWFLKEIRLRGRGEPHAEELAAAPVDRDSVNV